MDIAAKATLLKEQIGNGASDSDVIQFLQDLLKEDRIEFAQEMQPQIDEWGDVAEEAGMKFILDKLLTR